MSQLGAFFAGMIDENQKIKQADKVAKAMYDFVSPPTGQDGGQPANPLGPKDQWDLMSAKDRVARATAFTQTESLKRLQAKEQQESELHDARMAEFRAQQASNNALANAVGAAGRETPAEVLNRGQGPTPMQPVTATPDRLMRAVSSVPAAVNSPNFDNLMRALESGQSAASVMPQETTVGGRKLIFNPKSGVFTDVTPEADGGIDFSEDPVSGVRFARLGKSLASSGTNPDKAGGVVALQGPNGENFGYGIRNKSGVTPINTGKIKDIDKYNRVSRRLDSLVAAQGKAAEGRNARLVEAYQKQIDTAAKELQALEGADDGPKIPTAGEIRDGYRFKGGNPADQNNWEPVS